MRRERLPIVRLNDEPMSISVVRDKARGRISLSHVPEKLLPSLVHTFGKEIVDSTLAPSDVAMQYWRDLPLTKRAVPRHRDLYASGELKSRVKKLREQGKLDWEATYFMATINRGDEAIVGRTGGIYFVCKKGCLFCQYRYFPELKLDAKGIASRMMALERAGADNIQLVSPTVYTPLILEALLYAIEDGFTLPIIHKSEGEDSPSDLAMLEGAIDMYLPDAKFIRPSSSVLIGLPPKYPERMQVCLKEMYRQVGPLARRTGPRPLQGGGVFIRHLLMPSLVEDTKELLEFVATIDPALPIRIMANYEPQDEAMDHPVIGRRTTEEELLACVEHAKELQMRYVLVG